MDLRERLELTRHVRGCALLDEHGRVLGALGHEADEAVSGARALAACFSAIGVAEASFAGTIEVADADKGARGQVLAQTECGRLLVVRTDGEIALSEECLDVLREALTPKEDRIPFESGIRESGVVSREAFENACVRELDGVRARTLKSG